MTQNTDIEKIQTTQATAKTDLFNPQQHAAIEHVDGPLLIVAGAGSGKTMVLTHKIARLIQTHRVRPDTILAITFTNKAANEMKTRVAALLSNQVSDQGVSGVPSQKPYISTFHAFCGDVLRHQFHHIGGDRNYVIFDSADQTRVMKAIIKELGIDDKKYPHQRLLSAIESFKNQLVSVEQVKATPYEFKANPIIADVYERYQNQLWQNRAIDFTDMLYWVVMLFYNVPEVLAQYQAQYEYILVDEYQDTNHAQYSLIRLLTQVRQNITVVGDFDQNIYSWRGANIQNILNFEVDYPAAKTIVLEQNYRSTQTILKAANAVIAQNENRREKNLWTENGKGDTIHHYIGADEHREARYIATEIQKLNASGHTFKEIVVVYRVNALTRALEEKLNQLAIPYQIIGGLKFFERKEIKDLVAYLRLIHNPHDDAAFMRIANIPARDIGTTTLEKLQRSAREKRRSMMEVAADTDTLSARAKKAVFQFHVMIQSLADEYAQEKSLGVHGLIRGVLEKSGYQKMLEDDLSDQARDRLENCLEFISVAQEESLELGEFIHKVALATDLETSDDAAEKVTLMTLHNAKGLEYDTVFIMGFENGMLPYYRAFDDPKQMEEERRLCYVGMTRARRKLVLTSCVKRHVFGEIKYQAQSPFVEDIPEALCHTSRDEDPSHGVGSRGFSRSSGFGDFESRRGGWTSTLSNSATGTIGHSYDRQSRGIGSATSSSRTGIASSTKSTANALPNFEVNQRVDHSRWGTGKIIKIDGSGESAIIHVLFPSAGLKKLMAKFAPLTILKS